MKYYNIDFIGGVACFEKPGKVNDINLRKFYGLIDLSKSKPIHKNLLENFIMTELRIKWRKTEILSNSFGLSNGFFATKRAIEILNNFDVAPYKIYEGKFSNTPVNYYFLFFLTDSSKNIDFQQTKFYQQELETRKVIKKDIFFKDEKEYNEKMYNEECNANHYLQEISMKNNDYDLFTIDIIGRSIFCSESLKNALEKERIKGLSFREANFITRKEKN